MAPGNRFGIQAGNTEHVIQSGVESVIVDAPESGFDRSDTASSEPREPIELPDDLVVNRDYKVNIQQDQRFLRAASTS